MPLSNEEETLPYRRARFGTRLPVNRLYTRAHFWLLEIEKRVYRIGLARFATRMLGEIVEFQIDVPAGSAVKLGQRLGWIEGFKAVSEVYSAAEGTLAEVNPRLREDITLIESDCYGEGWLYRVAGLPDPGCVDVTGYVATLDATIDKMLGERYEGGEW